MQRRTSVLVDRVHIRFVSKELQREITGQDTNYFQTESGSIPLRNWNFLLIPSPIPELALLSPGGIGIELELPSFELESELRSSELNSELPSWN